VFLNEILGLLDVFLASQFEAVVVFFMVEPCELGDFKKHSTLNDGIFGLNAFQLG